MRTCVVWVCVESSRRRGTQSSSSRSEYRYRNRFCTEPLSHSASLWPWNRITASSAEVDATTCGTELLKPCGMSTHTYGSSFSWRNSSVSSRFSSVSQDLWRNSTQIRRGFARSAHSTRYSLFERRIVNHGGNWNSTAPIFPLRSSGASASKKLDQRYSTASSSRSFGYTRSLPSGRISCGSAVAFVGCWVRIENALMLNVKSGGVRCTHCCTTGCRGG